MSHRDNYSDYYGNDNDNVKIAERVRREMKSGPGVHKGNYFVL